MSRNDPFSVGFRSGDEAVPRSERWIGWTALGAGSLLVQLCVVTAIHAASVLPYVVYLVGAILGYVILWRRLRWEIFWLYQWYALAVLVLYLAQRLTLPEYHGLSGGLGIGTDDTFYFLQVAESAPHDLPAHDHGRPQHSFSKLLLALSFWSIRHPLDILFLNAAVACFIPLFTRELARLVTSSGGVARIAFWLSLFCPFLLSNSAILIRDGWTAALFAGALVCLLSRRFVSAAALGLMLAYVRLASALQVFAAAVVFALLLAAPAGAWASARVLRSALVLAAAAVGAVAIAPVALSFLASEGLLAAGLFREDFIYWMSQRTGRESILNEIAGAGLWLRVPVSFAFFLTGPFLGLDVIVQDGIFVPRFFLTTLFAVLFIAYFGFLVRGSVVALQRADRGILVTLCVLCLLVLAISQLSLVIRHKTMLMPLFYIVIAYGVRGSSSLGTAAGVLASAALLGVQLVAALAEV